MNVTLKTEGAPDVATTLQDFLADNADSITASEGRKMRALLLQHGNTVIIGGGAAPLVELIRAD